MGVWVLSLLKYILDNLGVSSPHQNFQLLPSWADDRIPWIIRI
jgi:hypothetical protein